jgi:addiction module HigA family antidote
MIRIPTDRAPTHPGEMLLQEFLLPMAITQRELAEATRLPPDFIDALTKGEKPVTASASLRLARFFGVSADFWMNLQLRWDLYQAQREEADALQNIQPYKAA